MNLEDIFKEIFDESKYQKCRAKPLNGENPWYGLFNDQIPKTLKSLVQRLKGDTNSNYTCKGTIGKGVLSDTFSFFIMNDSVTKRAQDGVYIAYLVAPGGKSIHLTFIQGTEIISSQAQLEQRRKKLTAEGNRIIEAFKNYVKDVGGDDYSGTFVYGHIDLGGLSTSMTTQAYEIATILSKEYRMKDGIPSENVLEMDLSRMLAVYRRYLTLINTHRL